MFSTIRLQFLAFIRNNIVRNIYTYNTLTRVLSQLQIFFTGAYFKAATLFSDVGTVISGILI